MNWLPYHRFDFHSPLAQDAALEALSKNVEAIKWFRWRWPSSANDDRFEGSIDGDRFNVRRIIDYRNSFLPQVRGAIAGETRGSRVTITMHLHPFVAAFISIWCLAVASFLVAVIASRQLPLTWLFHFSCLRLPTF